MNVRPLLILALLAIPHAALSQGFAGLGQAADGYAIPDPDTRFSFPEDHGAHPEYRIEWWYVTANLTDAAGTEYGIQWTLFRSALAPGGAAKDQAWMAHAAVSTPDGHLYAERFARGGIGQADVTADPFEAYIDEWQMSGPTLSNLTVTAQSDQFHYDLSLTTTAPLVPQGVNGYSVKSAEGQASYYYSQPFYSVTGMLTLPSGPVEVTGNAWLDREWSSQPLSDSQSGWDWVSLHFDSGDKMMGFRVRDEVGDPYIVGTWINADGTPRPIAPGELTMVETARHDIARRSIPTAFDIELLTHDLDISVTAIYPDSWMGTFVPYWEGPVRIKGSHTGTGYLEMSGY